MKYLFLVFFLAAVMQRTHSKPVEGRRWLGYHLKITTTRAAATTKSFDHQLKDSNADLLKGS